MMTAVSAVILSEGSLFRRRDTTLLTPAGALSCTRSERVKKPPPQGGLFVCKWQCLEGIPPGNYPHTSLPITYWKIKCLSDENHCLIAQSAVSLIF